MKKENHRRILADNIYEKLKGESAETIEQEASLAYDRKQFLVRVPKKISTALEIQKGEKVKFKLVVPKGVPPKQCKLEITFR